MSALREWMAELGAAAALRYQGLQGESIMQMIGSAACCSKSVLAIPVYDIVWRCSSSRPASPCGRWSDISGQHGRASVGANRFLDSLRAPIPIARLPSGNRSVGRDTLPRYRSPVSRFPPPIFRNVHAHLPGRVSLHGEATVRADFTIVSTLW